MDAMTLLHERGSMGKLTGPAPRPSSSTPCIGPRCAPRITRNCGPGASWNSPVPGSSVSANCLPRPSSARIRISMTRPECCAQETAARADDHRRDCSRHAGRAQGAARGAGALRRLCRSRPVAGGPRPGARCHVAHRAIRLRSHRAQGLGLDEQDELVGFIYLGQLGGRHRPLPEHDPSDFVERWS